MQKVSIPHLFGSSISFQHFAQSVRFPGTKNWLWPTFLCGARLHSVKLANLLLSGSPFLCIYCPGDGFRTFGGAD